MQVSPSVTNSDDAWLQSAPRLRPELICRIRGSQRSLQVGIEDPTRAKHFQVGAAEYQFISKLDGSRTIEEIFALMTKTKGSDAVNIQTVREIYCWLVDNNLLLGNGASTAERLAKSAHQLRQQNWCGLLNPVAMKFDLLNPTRVLVALTPYCSWLFTRWAFLVWVVLQVWALAAIANHWERFCDGANGVLAPEKWIYLLGIGCLLKAFHELGHGVACRRFGGEVPRAGVLLLLFAPLAYVDVTSSWRFSGRRNRMIVAAAGMYVELMLAAIAAIIWARSAPGLISDLAYNIILVAGFSTIVINGNPLIRFDGYYLLSDALGVVNLYSKGQRWVRDRWFHLLFGFPKSRAICGRSESWIVASYGLAAFLWRIVLCASLLLMASALFHGAGVILAIVGACFWVFLPLLSQFRLIQKQRSQHGVRWKRVLTNGVLLPVVALLLLWLKAPSVTRAPAIVQFEEEYVMRATSDGFITHILVQDGQRVTEGQPLVVLANPNLTLELLDLQLAGDKASINSRIHQSRNELADHQTEMQKLAKTRVQIEEKQKQIEQQTVRAPAAGVVLCRGLDNLEQSFVKRGDPILRIADPDRKELLLSVDQQQIKSVRNAAQSSMRVAFSGLPLLHAHIRTYQPRASEMLPADSMGAQAGGPLAVRPGEDADSVQLIQPRFSARLALAPGHGADLRAGQLGVAFLPGRDQSLASCLFQACRQWVHEKLSAATTIPP